ncbi:hypothetical protein [Azospirillum largimobile]
MGCGIAGTAEHRRRPERGRRSGRRIVDRASGRRRIGSDLSHAVL